MAYSTRFNVKERIRALKLEKMRSITEAEIYQSPEMKKHVSTVLEALTGDLAPKLRVKIFYDENDSTVGYTDGNEAVLNANSELIRLFHAPEQRYNAFMGVAFHECAHRIFMDFEVERKALDFVQNGLWFGADPAPENDDEILALKELNDAMNNKLYRMMFAEIFHTLSNITADAHDEAAMKILYPGTVARAINTTAEALFLQTSSLERQEKLVQEGKLSELSCMYNLCLQYVRFGKIHSESETPTGELYDNLVSIAPAAEMAIIQDDPKKKYGYLNAIVLKLWPYIKKALEKAQQEQNQENNNSSDQSNNTSNQVNELAKAIQKIMEQLQKGKQNISQNPMPKTGKSSKTAKQRTKAQSTLQQPQQNNAQQTNNAATTTNSAILNQIASGIAQTQAEQEAEMEEIQAENAIIATIDKTSSHVGVPVHYQTVLDYSEHDEAEYHKLMDSLLPISKRMQREIQNALREMEDNGIARHKHFGKILEVNQSYRLDQRFYANKKKPQDMPSMAVFVLVDNSGSMNSGQYSGERINNAKRGAMLLYDFAKGLNIPVAVAGHRTDGNAVNFATYVDFNTARNHPEYRIAKMRANGCNRDGLALLIAGNKLARRPETVKLLLIISDGQPNHNGYGGNAAAKDIQDIVKNLRRQGVEVIAAAIGSDKERIQNIYSVDGGFMDVTDVQKLPRIMANIVKKRVVNQIV